MPDYRLSFTSFVFTLDFDIFFFYESVHLNNFCHAIIFLFVYVIYIQACSFI